MKKHIPGLIILLCAAVVIIWQTAGLLARRPGDDFALKAADFDSFELKLNGWTVEKLEVTDTFMEVNLLKHLVRTDYRLQTTDCRPGPGSDGDVFTTKSAKYAKGGAGVACETHPSLLAAAMEGTAIDSRLKTEDRSPNSTTQQLSNLTTDLRNAQVLVRLVHGYNMRDCMRIKGYEVQELDFEKPEGETEDRRLKTADNGDGISGLREELSGSQVDESGRGGLTPPMIYREKIESGLQSSVSSLQSSPTQLWLLTSPSGDTSLWLSGMLRAGDFSGLNLSVTDMPFPRVGTPTDPNWIPRGLTWQSLRHPIRNFKFMINAKWNGARCDLLTFLRLRKPAWASDDALTLLVIRDISPDENEDEAAALMQAIYSETLSQLRSWRSEE